MTFSSLPTINDRQGIFPVAVQNPFTGEVFQAGTPIPAGQIAPFARQVLDALPAPNDGPEGGRSNNFRELRADRNNNDKMDLKLDGQISSRMSFFARGSHRKSNIFQAPTIPGASGGGGNGFIRALNQQLALSYTYTLSPSSLIEARFGYSRTRAGKEPPGLGGPGMLELFGIPGLPDDPRIRGGLTPQEVTGFSAFGRQATNPQWQHPDVWNPKIVFSHIRGRHSVKAGWEYQRIHTEIQDVNPLVGRDIFNGQFSRLAGAPSDPASFNLADFLFGARSEFQLVNFFVAQYRQEMNFAFFQDDWKVAQKLTLNLGLRYEYATPQWEKDNRLTNFDPVGNRLVPATSGSIASKAQVNPDRNNFAPRFGLAYSVDPRTVVRAGYGVSFIHFNRAGGGNVLAINGPQVVTAVVAQRPSDPGFLRSEQGFPAGLTDPQNFDPLRANISFIPRDTRSGYAQNWSFSIQREILPNTVVDIGYVGSKSTKLIIFADFNQARTLTPEEALLPTARQPSIQARRPNPAFSAITITTPDAFANYHALQARIERRAAGGLYFLNSFVWSKAIDNTGQALEAQQGSGGRSSPQNFFNLAAERAVSDFDQTFNNTTAVVWDLPFGRGRRFGSSVSKVADYAFGGWQVSVINNLWSGNPINLAYNPPGNVLVSQTLLDWRGGISYRPNVIGPVKTPKDQRSIDNFLSRENIVLPTDPSQPFGNAGRNIARRPGLFQMDLGLSKSFPLWREGASLQFRTEAFNLTNKTNFGNPQINRSSPAFGTIRQTFPARQVQFALRLVS